MEDTDSLALYTILGIMPNRTDEEKKEIILKDYKIEVPDTFKNKKELDLINLIILLIYAKIFNIYNFNYNNLFNHFI